MKHSILLVVPRPEKKDGWVRQQWESLPSTFAKLANKYTTLEVIGEHVLMIQLNATLEPLVQILSEIGELDYRYAIFDEEIQWLGGLNKP